MNKLNLLEKFKNYIFDKDRSLILLILCVIVIISMCCCLMSQINQYKRNCEELSAQYDQRLDRCEELLIQLEDKCTNVGED